jgi:hypothetical protein
MGCNDIVSIVAVTMSGESHVTHETSMVNESRALVNNTFVLLKLLLFFECFNTKSHTVLKCLF